MTELDAAPAFTIEKPVEGATRYACHRCSVSWIDDTHCWNCARPGDCSPGAQHRMFRRLFSVDRRNW